MSNETIITNLETLLYAVKVYPEALFNLKEFKQEEACGTLFCTVGLAASMPYFMELGLGWKKLGFNWWTVQLDGESLGCVPEELNEIFGEDAFDSLFDRAAEGLLDAGLGYTVIYDDFGYITGQNMTDKELAIKRLESRIAFYKEQA